MKYVNEIRIMKNSEINYWKKKIRKRVEMKRKKNEMKLEKIFIIIINWKNEWEKWVKKCIKDKMNKRNKENDEWKNKKRMIEKRIEWEKEWIKW